MFFKAYLCPNLISTLANLKMNDFSHSDKDFSLTLFLSNNASLVDYGGCAFMHEFLNLNRKSAQVMFFSTRMVFTILSLVSLTNFLQSYFNKKCVGRLIMRQLVRINKWTFLLTEKPDFWVSWFCGFAFWFLFQLDSRSISFCNVIQ